MKVITIKQPYASLIREGYKRFEFRTWKTSYRGKIYIHAGLGVDKEAMKRVENLNLEYPQGEMIAEAEITDCILVDDEMKKNLKKENEQVYYGIIHHEGKQEYAFQLENIKKIKPIKAKGKLSLWNYQ